MLSERAHDQRCDVEYASCQCGRKVAHSGPHICSCPKCFSAWSTTGRQVTIHRIPFTAAQDLGVDPLDPQWCNGQPPTAEEDKEVMPLDVT